ncbi:MAG: sugar nucleotide-binding protein [Alphaproteobacteria bacterium]|nr:sugar nucleotide-binding protein [Alphaproteobacteria bacterium]
MKNLSKNGALIIGASGTIGKALHAAIGGTPFTRAELDLADNSEHWPEFPPADVAYLCAAATKLETCEKNPEATQKINVTHMQILAERLQKNGTFIVFLSSNQVFDGSVPFRKTTDAPCPVNEYGRQKAVFEAWLLARNIPAAVLRLTKVVSGPLPITRQWEEALRKGEAVEAFDDLRFAPLPLESVLAALHDIGIKKRAGIFHLSGTHDISYYRIAQMLAQKIGVDSALVRPASAASKGIAPQFLPAHGTLECSIFDGITIPDPEYILFSSS